MNLASGDRGTTRSTFRDHLHACGKLKGRGPMMISRDSADQAFATQERPAVEYVMIPFRLSGAITAGRSGAGGVSG